MCQCPVKNNNRIEEQLVNQLRSYLVTPKKLSKEHNEINESAVIYGPPCTKRYVGVKDIECTPILVGNTVGTHVLSS